MPRQRSNLGHAEHPNEIIRTAWQRGIEVLRPTRSQLEHGLELHRCCLACDNFGFFPSVWSPEVRELWQSLQDAHLGAEQHQWETLLARQSAATRDAEAAAEFLAAFDAAGLKGLVLTVAEGKARDRDIALMAVYRNVIRVFRHRLRQAGGADELREAAEDGRIGVVWSVNGPPLVGKLMDLEEELSWIDTWYRLGVRLMHLTYNRRNFVGDGCSEPANGGLSDLGRELVHRLNRVGIVVDSPHSGIRTTLDAAATTQKPMMASHTGARAVFDHMRCKSDEELRAIADTDGLIGVYVLPNMLGPEANLKTMLDHVDYIARLVGPDHVAIGTDTCYQPPWPEGLKGFPSARYSGSWWGNWKPDNHPLPSTDEASRGSLAWTNWPLYTVGLVQRGHSDQDIAGILGGNLLRVLDANRPDHEYRHPPAPGV